MNAKADDPYAFPEKLNELTFGTGPSRALQINSIETAWRLATLIVKARMAPSGMETVEQVTVALLHGAEIGLPPMMSVQKIAVIGGRPTVWGDAALAVVRNSGLLEDISEYLEGEGDDRTAWCTVTRKGYRAVSSTFSVKDAKVAGLWDERETVRRKMKYDGWFNGRSVKAGEWADLPNDAPWRRFPDRMLAARARGYRLRDSFPDCLSGMYLREEFIGGQVIEHDPAEGFKSAQGGSRSAQDSSGPPQPPEEDTAHNEFAGEGPPPPPVDDGPPEPPKEPAGPKPMSAGEVDHLISLYEEQIRGCDTEDRLDDLWMEHISPLIEAKLLNDTTLARLQTLDDERRGMIFNGAR